MVEHHIDARDDYSDGDPAECPACKGSGSVIVWVADESDRSGQSDRKEAVECPECSARPHGVGASAGGNTK